MTRFGNGRSAHWLVLAVLTWTLAQPLPATADDNWPQFRGPRADGVGEGSNLPEKWSKTENVAWTCDIPGRGWSSPIVWGDKIFVTTAVRADGKTEEVKKGLYFGGERPTPKEPHRWVVYAIDAAKGKVVWEKTVHEGVPGQGHHLKNTLASETPVTDGQHIYAYFGNVGVFCLDMKGEVVWKKLFDPMPTKLGWGTAASPVLHDGRLFIVNDNEKKSHMLALNAADGEEIWKVERDEKSNWATPFIWQNEKRTEIVTSGSKRVRSYDLDGHPLWELGGMSVIAIPTPFEHFGMLFVASGYVLDPNQKPIFAIRPGASGDISLKDKATSNEFIAWTQRQAGPYNVSPIVYGDNIYVLYDMGFFACFDAKTGKQVYDQPKIRFPKGGNFTASPWAYNDKIFCLNEDGDTSVVKAGPKFEVLHTNSLDELCMATPAIADNSLFIRTETKLYRITNGATLKAEAAANP